MTSRKDLAPILKSLRDQGFEVELARRRCHYKVRKDGEVVGGLPSTPSDYRGLLNARAALRRVGWIDPTRTETK